MTTPREAGSSTDDTGHPQLHTDRISLGSAATRAWQVVGLALAAAIVTFLLVRLRVVVVACLLALLIAATLGPAMGNLVDRGWRRSTSAMALTVGWLAALGLVFSAVGWQLAQEIPQVADEATAALEDLRARGIPIPEVAALVDSESPSADAAEETAGTDDGESAAAGTDGEGSGGEGAGEEDAPTPDGATALAGLRIGAEVLTSLVLAVVLSFFLLRDGNRMWRWSVAALDPPQRRLATRMGVEAYTTVAQYVRGLSVVATADALLSAIGLFALGVPLASVLAVLTFFGAFVPAVGAFVVGGLAIALALASGGVGLALATLVVYTAIQQLDSNVLQPWIMGQRLPLHPAVVLLALTTGGVVAGVVGALLGVPVAAAIVAATRVYLLDDERPAADPSIASSQDSRPAG